MTSRLARALAGLDPYGIAQTLMSPARAGAAFGANQVGPSTPPLYDYKKMTGDPVTAAENIRSAEGLIGDMKNIVRNSAVWAQLPERPLYMPPRVAARDFAPPPQPAPATSQPGTSPAPQTAAGASPIPPAAAPAPAQQAQAGPDYPASLPPMPPSQQIGPPAQQQPSMLPDSFIPNMTAAQAYQREFAANPGAFDKGWLARLLG